MWNSCCIVEESASLPISKKQKEKGKNTFSLNRTMKYQVNPYIDFLLWLNVAKIKLKSMNI